MAIGFTDMANIAESTKNKFLQGLNPTPGVISPTATATSTPTPPKLPPAPTGGGMMPPTPSATPLSPTPTPTLPKVTPTPSPVVPTVSAAESKPMNLFSNEQEAFAKMKADNVPDDQAYQMIKDHRNELMGGNTGLTPMESAALLKMQQDGVSSEDAVKMLQENRQANKTAQTKPEDTRPLWKKAGEGAVNLMAGNLETVLKYGGNLLDLGTAGQAGFGQDVKAMTEQNKQLFGDSTAFKAGTYLPDVAMTVAPLGKAVQGMSAVKGGALVGAGFGASQPLLEKGSEATAGEVAKGAAVGGLTGAVAGPVLGKAVEKGAKYGTALVKGGLEGLGKSVSRDVSGAVSPIGEVATRSIPKKVVSGDLGFTPTERAKIEKITGNDEASYVLSKGLAGKGKEEMAQVFQKQADDMYNGITERLANVDKTVKSPVAQSALEDIVSQLESSPKLQKAYAKDIAGAKAMLNKGEYTLSDLNNIRRAYDKVNTGMYTTQGTVKSGIENAVDVKIRDGLSSQLQKEAKLAGIDVKQMNSELRAGLVMKDALLRRLSQEERNNFIGLQDLGVSAILSGGNPVTAVATMAAKKYGEKIAPSVAQKLYNINQTPNVPRTVTRGNTVFTNSKSSLLNLAGSNRTTMAGEQVTPKLPRINLKEEIAKANQQTGLKPNPLDLSKNKKGFISPKAIETKKVLTPKAPTIENPGKGGIFNIKPENQVKYNQGNGYEPVRLALNDKDAIISSYGALNSKIIKTGGFGTDSQIKTMKEMETKLGMTRKEIIERAKKIREIASENRNANEVVYIDMTSGKPKNITGGNKLFSKK